MDIILKMEISELAQVQPLFNQLQSGDYLVLDLDDTCIEVKHCNGKIFNAMLDDPSISIDVEMFWLQKQVPEHTSIVDPYIYDLISQAEEKGIKVLGCTARTPKIRDLTYQQLQAVNLRIPEIIFCDHDHKGQALQQYLGHQPDIQILFIDDCQYNCDDVKEIYPDAYCFTLIK